jgi:hypothetical protein
MRVYEYCEPGDNDDVVYVRITEADIIREYFPYWSRQMRKVKQEDQITEDRCIEDFCIVHWAYQVEGENE